MGALVRQGMCPVRWVSAAATNASACRMEALRWSRVLEMSRARNAPHARCDGRVLAVAVDRQRLAVSPQQQSRGFPRRKKPKAVP